jgi:tetratricopeptide (TPR) repeat protein
VKHNVLFAQASGNEFLGEDAVHRGDYEASLKCAEREIEIAERLHSRERRAWVHFYESSAHFHLGETERAIQEVQRGIELAESIGERRALSLLNTNLAIAQAKLGQFDEALETATANAERAAEIGLLYTHFEALRALADVHFKRALSGMHEGALDQAADVCRQAEELIAPSESRVSRLWLGPLYIEVLLAQNKRDEAREKLTAYQSLVAECQTPRFTAEATRLTGLVGK